MIQKTFAVGPFQCNCTILGCEKTKEAVLIDPGDEGDRILREINELGVTIKYVLHTHAHLDHIGATSLIKERLNPTLYLHEKDGILYDNLPKAGLMFGLRYEKAPPIDKYFQDLEIIQFGECEIKVLHTPGHTPGSVCFQLLKDDERLFSGDTLFRESVGRTDLWGGNQALLFRSIRERLLSLDDKLVVYPGHGEKTTIGHERRNNPFLQ